MKSEWAITQVMHKKFVAKQYSFHGFPLYHMIIRKNSTLYKHLLQQGFVLKNSKIKEHIYVADNKGCLLTATNYRYVGDKKYYILPKDI